MVKAVIAAVLVISAAAAMPLHCYGDVSDEDMRTIEGTVTSVDLSASTIQVQEVNSYTFSVPPDAKLTSDIYDIKLSDINTGSYIKVSFYTDNSGKRIATEIFIDYNKK